MSVGPTVPSPDVLLVGCGRLGADVGLRLAATGHRVAGLRRRVAEVPAPIVGVPADLTREVPTLPPLDLGLLAVVLTARPRTEESDRATYLDGMRRALDALDAQGARPERAVLVSSTAVNGDVEGTVTEDTPPAPADAPAQVLLEAEQVFLDRVPTGTVLRLSGLYGDGTPRMVEEVRSGQVRDPHRWTNRIHRSDAAAAAVHLLTAVDDPAPVYLGTDDEPALRGDVAAHLADRLGLPPLPPTHPEQGHGKRISNALLRSTGWRPHYPTFREGHAEVGPSDG
jgi:nucleoside-diphosphate-sugar epimerase